jgi:NAD+ synthase
MSLQITQPEQVVAQLVTFIQQTFSQQQKKKAVIAISGGIDSALAATLLTRALGSESVTALFLPFADQSLVDSQTICRFLQIPETQQITQNIAPAVQQLNSQLQISASETVRTGNLMARTRMMIVYDYAKKLDALVCGTENKSEHYLGYFTRFGDAASDLEPISTLYKTQVRQLAQYLQLPEVFLTKAPSAGLWKDQTDEQEMGFSYQQADLVLEQLIDLKKEPAQIQLKGVALETVQKILDQVQAMAFKLQVPYELKDSHA